MIELKKNWTNVYYLHGSQTISMGAVFCVDVLCFQPQTISDILL